MYTSHWTVNINSMKDFIPEDFIALDGIVAPGRTTCLDDVLRETVLSDFSGWVWWKKYRLLQAILII